MHCDCLIPHAVDPAALEDSRVVHTVDERADLDRIVTLLERYPLNTTLDLGEPLTSDEIASKYLTFLCVMPPPVVLILCKRSVFLPLNSSVNPRPRSER
jgi:hypothetical protein